MPRNSPDQMTDTGWLMLETRDLLCNDQSADVIMASPGVSDNTESGVFNKILKMFLA